MTALLARWQAGEAQAFDDASALVYPELRKIAAAYLARERPGHTLQPTALINEAFVRLVNAGELTFQGRAHFFSLAATIMRRVLVDHARAWRADKRGGGIPPLALDTGAAGAPQVIDDFLELHDALDRLAAVDRRKAEILELRYFGGLSLEEAAAHFGLSTSTIHREQRFAEAWLSETLNR
ncbi:MAG: ECF-type sigma factor [Vicinamibacterales bacterium]